MAKKPQAPVYFQKSLHANETRWECATCKAYLAFSLPIPVPTMGLLLQTFSKAHERCAPGPGEPAEPSTPTEQPVEGPDPDPTGAVAKAQARRENLLALPRDHTAAERHELGQLEAMLYKAGVLTLSATF